MKKKIKYAKGDIGDIKVVRDFLPVPEQLAFKEDSKNMRRGTTCSIKR